MMKEILKKVFISSICLFSILLLAGCSNTKQKSKLVVGIVQIQEHSSLNTIRQATINQLKSQAKKRNLDIDIVYKNAQGNQSNLNTICKQFSQNKVDVIVAIATPSAQAAAQYAKDIPVVFAAVSDPIGAGLVKDLTKPDKNITGTSDEVQVDQIMDLALEMYPETKTVGLLYNSGEANSVSNIKRVKEYLETNSISYVEGTVTNTSEVQTATQVLANKCDIIFTPNDNTVASAMEVVAQTTKQLKIPCFVGADSMVGDGGLATVGINYKQLGKETGTMVIKVLKGTAVADIPVKVFKKDLSIYINKTTAAKIGYTNLSQLENKYKNIEYMN